MRTWYESLLEKNTRLFVEIRQVPRVDGIPKKEIMILGFVHKNTLGSWDAFMNTQDDMSELGSKRELWEAQRLLQLTIKRAEEKDTIS
ncbi:hypothetical protein [Runella sp.]|uniref:hypothetical protein n=1 Tax=Runella sp. TaxID=1960881 RepID=UPI003D0CB0C0